MSDTLPLRDKVPDAEHYAEYLRVLGQYGGDIDKLDLYDDAAHDALGEVVEMIEGAAHFNQVGFGWWFIRMMNAESEVKQQRQRIEELEAEVLHLENELARANRMLILRAELDAYHALYGEDESEDAT